MNDFLELLRLGAEKYGFKEEDVNIDWKNEKLILKDKQYSIKKKSATQIMELLYGLYKENEKNMNKNNE